jgi:uncharacterized damage-inducible protein DinB
MTTGILLPRPAAGDAASYYFTYIDKVPDGDVLALLETSLDDTRQALAAVDAERETFRYAPGKWTVRDVVGHLLDAERVFGYRAFHFARADPAELPSMDQEIYARTARAERRPLAEVLDELADVRRGHLALFRGFDDEAWERTGIASNVPFRVRAIPFILAGHEIHHRQILVERYL